MPTRDWRSLTIRLLQHLMRNQSLWVLATGHRVRVPFSAQLSMSVSAASWTSPAASCRQVQLTSFTPTATAVAVAAATEAEVRRSRSYSRGRAVTPLREVHPVRVTRSCSRGRAPSADRAMSSAAPPMAVVVATPVGAAGYPKSVGEPQRVVATPCRRGTTVQAAVAPALSPPTTARGLRSPVVRTSASVGAPPGPPSSYSGYPLQALPRQRAHALLASSPRPVARALHTPARIAEAKAPEVAEPPIARVAEPKAQERNGPIWEDTALMVGKSLKASLPAESSTPPAPAAPLPRRRAPAAASGCGASAIMGAEAAVPSLRFVAGSSSRQHPRKQQTGIPNADVIEASQSLLGICDGVSGVHDLGIPPDLLPRELLRSCRTLHEEQNLRLPAGGAGKRGGNEAWLVGLAESAYTATQAYGATTLLLAALRDGDQLVSSCVGDCALMLLRPVCLHPLQLEVVFRTEAGRIDSRSPVQVQRLPGVSDALACDVIRGAQTHTIQVKARDLVVLGSDGIFDNLSDQDIRQALEWRLSGPPGAAAAAADAQMGPRPCWAARLDEAAASLVDFAIARVPQGEPLVGNADDTTALVAVVVESSVLEPPASLPVQQQLAQQMLQQPQQSVAQAQAGSFVAAPLSSQAAPLQRPNAGACAANPAAAGQEPGWGSFVAAAPVYGSFVSANPVLSGEALASGGHHEHAGFGAGGAGVGSFLEIPVPPERSIGSFVEGPPAQVLRDRTNAAQPSALDRKAKRRGLSPRGAKGLGCLGVGRPLELDRSADEGCPVS
eukprot:TRINITY_DN22064_c0_g2_i1.p1 TRINITY_DN22064_c0_g2~~TRINITY_DN22064_c0_g2_i1.p1  ORF type:complete len:782 (+),score=110.41 TRINITY_DN22064_c0_g2_i1:42-2387(+)